MDPGLGGNTEKATLEWLAEALEHARARGQTKLVGYLEEVADEVAFEVGASRGRASKLRPVVFRRISVGSGSSVYPAANQRP